MRNELIAQADDYNSFNHSLVEKACFNNTGESLAQLGLDSAMRASVVRGIKEFTDFDNLHDTMVSE